MASLEFDLCAADTFLAKDVDASSTSLTLGHDSGVATVVFPAAPFWVVLDPDDPSARENVLVTALTGPTATVRRNFVASPPGTGIPHKVGTRVRLGVRAGAFGEPWHVVGANGEPAFTNNWVNHGGGYATVAFMRTPDGLVLLRGIIDPGSANTAAFTLPAGYRPGDGTIRYEYNGNFLEIGTNGQVKPLTAVGYALDFIRFQANN